MEVPEVWLIGGTRPEAIKLAPLALALSHGRRVAPMIVSTGQHPTMFHQGLEAFGLNPDLALEPNRVTGTQAELVSLLTHDLDFAVRRRQPSAVVVQGDTASALVGALTAFWNHVPVVHLEAGLRSHDLDAPFPEEANRRMIGQIAALHLAPTPRAAANLRAEGVAHERIRIVGNTVVDAVLTIVASVRQSDSPALQAADDAVAAGDRLVLVTAHRRESWGEPLRSVLLRFAMCSRCTRTSWLFCPHTPIRRCVATWWRYSVQNAACTSPNRWITGISSDCSNSRRSC